MKFKFSVFVLMFAAIGCGGGEDFSQPPPGMADRLSKAATSSASLEQKASPPAQAANLPSQVTTSATGAEGSAAAGTVATGEVAASELSAGEKAPSPSTATTESGTPAASSANSGISSSKLSAAPQSAPVTANAENASAVTLADEATKSGDEELMTASGRTAKSLADKKEENIKQSVSGNAGGLLGSLKSTKAADAASKKPAANVDFDAPEALTRFGRMAISQQEWLRLVVRLSRRFYVATTPDGSRILASSGERSAGIVPVEIIPEEVGRFGVRTAQQKPVLQSMTSLPGQISCLELTNEGTHALFGTMDGRVLVRTVSSQTDWDLYARDLFLFQDEMRATARLSTEPLVLVRALAGDGVLTVDEKGQGAFWKLADVMPQIKSLESLSAADLASYSASVESPAPVSTFQIQGMQILSCTESEDDRWVAIVSSAETVTILDAATGEIVDELNAEKFNETQPVCVAFLPDRQELLAGLADGRIFRRSFGDTTPVSGTNDDGEPVDYDPVFIPDVKDRPEPVTCLRVVPGTNLVYVGSLIGNISRLDLTQRRMELLSTKHGGAVVELRLLASGALSIGDDRTGFVFDQPFSVVTREVPKQISLSLPTDEALKASSVVDADGNAVRRPPTRTQVQPEDAVDLALVGIRPPNAEIALLQHQLRATADHSKREALRKSIQKIQDGKSQASEQKKSYNDEAPILLSEYLTEFLFKKGGGWQDVKMQCSSDGQLAVVSHVSRPGVEVIDLPTGVVLRRWTELPNSKSLTLNEKFGRVFPSGPASAELGIWTGALTTNPLRQFLVCAVAPDESATIAGHFGSPGLAAMSLTLIDDAGKHRTDSMELFETMVTALEFSPGGESLYASFRSRDQTVLQELDPLSLSVRATLVQEELPGAVPPNSLQALDGNCGVTMIHANVSDRALLTSGAHKDGAQLRLWRRSGKAWPKENVVVMQEKDMLPDPKVAQPVAFVNNQDSKLAIVTTTGLSIVGTRKAKVEHQLPMPNVGSRRPCVCFSPDQRWLLAGDADGQVWAVLLNSPTRKPLQFSAHAGPIAGLSISANGKYLLTAGEDNRMRSWDISQFLSQ